MGVRADEYEHGARVTLVRSIESNYDVRGCDVRQSECMRRFCRWLLAVYRSPNGGVAGSWETRVDNRNSNILNRILFSDSTSAVCDDNVEIRSQGDYDNVIAVDPSDPEIVWVGGIDLWRSDDGGRNWGQASYWWASPPILSAFAPAYAHADNHGIAFHPQYNGTSNQIMFVGNDGGIQRTNNAKTATAKTDTNVCRTSGSQVTFARVNNNYSVTQFYHGAVFPDGSPYFGGTQDNGTNLGNDATGPAGWRVIHGGDGGFVAVNPTNPDVLYAETPQLAIVKSADRGLRFSKVTSGIREPNKDFLFIAPFTMDPTNPERLFIGAKTLWRTDNGAQFWTAASRPITIAGNFAAISAIAISPSNPGRVAVGTTEGFVHRMDGALSSTEATDWTLISKPRDGYISWLAFDPNNDRVLYATYSTFNFPANSGHVFRSVDAGATWTSIEGSGTTGIPDIPVLNILPDPANAGRLFVGSDVGVFASEDSGATWLRENTGFANAVTQTLTVNAGTPKSLFAFTHGRGVWKVPLGTTTTCNYSITGSPSTFPNSGGQGSVNVSTASGCAWEAKADASWITINSGSSGDGAGRIAFSVSVNDTQAERTGRITVANQVFVITQSALDCRYTVAPLTLTFNANGGASSVRVIAPAGCAWTAVSNISFLSITSGASGSGDGTVNIAAQSNPLGAARTGTLTVAGQTVNATQAGRQSGTGGAFDELSTSTRIETFPFTASFDTSTATSNGNDPSHSCTGDRDSNTVWFRFIPNFTGPLQVTTVGSGYDTVLAVYDNGNNEVACNDDLSRTVFQSSATVQVSAFQNYVIQVSGYGPSNPGGTMQLTISANDQISAATPITVVPFTFNQDTRYATVVDADPIHSCTRQKDAKSVWFRVQPTFTGRLMVDTVGSTYDTVLAVYQGTVPQQDIACSDDAADSFLSAINFAVTNGQTYLVQVTSYSSGGPGGQLRLNVANNDTPAFAQTIGPLPNFLEQSTAGAAVSAEDAEQTCSQERTGKRAWFRHTAISRVACRWRREEACSIRC